MCLPLLFIYYSLSFRSKFLTCTGGYILEINYSCASSSLIPITITHSQATTTIPTNSSQCSTSGHQSSLGQTIMQDPSMSSDPPEMLMNQMEAGAFRELCLHLRERSDEVQNIELMTLGGFCRNCLAKVSHFKREKNSHNTNKYRR